MPDINEIKKLLIMADEFVKAAHCRVSDEDANRAITLWEREDRNQAAAEIENLDAAIEKGGKSPAEVDEMTLRIGLKGLRIADAFAAAATRILGAEDAFVFLPAPARTAEMASAYAANGASALALLCRKSLE